MRLIFNKITQRHKKDTTKYGFDNEGGIELSISVLQNWIESNMNLDTLILNNV